MPLKKIICAVDFSPTSDFVVRYAAAMHGARAELIILYVDPEANNDAALQRKHLHEFSRYSDMLSQNDVCAAFAVQCGEPATVILDYAKKQNADMIVIGSHGSTAIARLLVGGTTETVMRNAFCPVVILKTPTESRTAAE